MFLQKLVVLLAAATLGSTVTLERDISGKSLHLPIQRAVRPSWKRDGEIRVGDVLDVTYNVVVQIGETLIPLIIDTGSADLWTISDSCGPCSKFGVPLYHQNALTPAGQDVQLLYGDSRTGTHATGPIGTDTVGFGGLSVPDQYFATIVDTNTTVLENGSAGILGLGFPPVSVIWRQLLGNEANQTMLSNHKRSPAFYTGETTPQEGLRPPASAVDSFAKLGPLFTRLVIENMLSRPMVVTTLQRDTVALSGNSGTLSLGVLPFDLTDDYLAWVPVRRYSVSEGGLPPPPSAPNEVYPMIWEIPLDDVYFDGVKLPRSTLSPPSVSLSALVDTGNSLIRGPQDIVDHIYTLLGNTFDCAIPHNLSFVIGGVLFPVDPRDFAHPAPVVPGREDRDELTHCSPALAATDPPTIGEFLYSWSLGVPFLKSALVAFYYGNMTHPSSDPPRVGFMSTVPSDADSALEQAVASAMHNGGIFPSTSEPAPYATPISMPMSSVAPVMTEGWQRTNSNGASLSSHPSLWTCSLMIAILTGLVRYL